MSKIEIKHRLLSGTVLFETELGVEYDNDSYSARLGAAVRIAVRARADLADANLSGAHLARSNLVGANLVGANLVGANLTGADLTGANLVGADLTGARLASANLTRADLADAYLARADLAYANLSGADLAYADLADANLVGADLARADLSGTNLTGADLTGAYFARAYLARTDLTRAKGINAHRLTPLLMLLDQPGRIRAYKLVDSTGYSPFNGRLRYVVGESVCVADADTDAAEHCGAGINVATLDWCMREWRPGHRILVVEFTAEDIAAIPTGTDGKFRLHRCDVVGEKDLAEIGLVPAKAAE